MGGNIQRFVPGEVLKDFVNVAIYLGRDAVNFHTIARGNQNNLGKISGELELAADATQT